MSLYESPRGTATLGGGPLVARVGLPIWAIIMALFVVAMTLYHTSLGMHLWQVYGREPGLLFSSISRILAALTLVIYLVTRSKFLLLIPFGLTLISLVRSIFMNVENAADWFSFFGKRIPEGLTALPVLKFTPEYYYSHWNPLAERLYEISGYVIALAILAALYFLNGKWSGKVSQGTPPTV